MREDTAAESDLVRGAYRDRLLTELAQNAADAAGGATDGALAVWLDGDELHVANTGAPLNAEGVQALSALRASGKEFDAGATGRFGVGFNAVLAVSDEIDVRSTSGSIRFSANETRAALATESIPVGAGHPILRLVWPIATPPADGWDTEVVLHLRGGIDGRSVLDDMAATAVDLLLELPALHSIRVAEHTVTRSTRTVSAGLDDVSIGDRRWWQYTTAHARWLLPVVDDVARPNGDDVLRAPTRSDEDLSIPAVVIADIEMQPDRRRVLPGAHVRRLAAGYADFAAALPVPDRIALIPAAGFARGEVDAQLREALLHELRDGRWLPVVGDDDPVVAPTRASVLPDLPSESAELLAELIPDLVIPDLSGRRYANVLAQLDVHRIGLAHVADAASGLDRAPHWWHRLYSALEPLVVDTVAAQELGALPVPLADGRLVTGPRTTVVGADLDLTGDVGVHWVRLVHPDAAHPLLERLGAKQAAPVDILSDPALRAAIDDGSDDDADQLADAVLAIAAHVVDPTLLPPWLGLLLLPDTAGELRSADELLLPDAPIAEVLTDESPFGTVDPALVDRAGPIALRALGVGWGFTVVREAFPTGPDHDLDDEDTWWDTLSTDPEEFAGIRDLDLVDDDRWPAALGQLAANPDTAPLLADTAGYTAWWLRRHARVDGKPLGTFRPPGDPDFAGLLDPLDHSDADVLTAVLAHPDRLDADLAQLLLDRLGDASRSPAPATIATVHALLAAAVASGRVDANDIALPERVRAVDGTLADPSTALVLDNSWIGAVVDFDDAVLGSVDDAAALADLLDIRLASHAITGVVVGTGRRTRWADVPGAVVEYRTTGRTLPDGAVTVHDELRVRLSGAVEGERRVPRWRDDDGHDHIEAR